MRLGILLVLMGLVWLGSRMGWFDHTFLGPMLVMLVGVWLVGVAVVKRQRVFSIVKREDVRHEE
jgi:uncharacterized membrane protein YidH (DUF202 family)